MSAAALSRKPGAARFLAEGAMIAFTYLRDEEGAAATAGMIRETGGDARTFKVSVLDNVATEAMVTELETVWGGIDILVTNAGVSQSLPLALLEAMSAGQSKGFWRWGV